MTDITMVPALESGRPETGPMQFGDDWPGVFFRGDNALFAAMHLSMALHKLPEAAWVERAAIKGLIEAFRSCKTGDTGWPPEAAKTEVAL